jgi:hypothetical protein
MTKWMATHPEDLDFTLDLGHASGSVDVPSSNQLHGDFFAPLHMQAQLDLSKLTLSQRLEQQVRTELGNGATRVGGSVGNGRRMRVDVTIGWQVLIRELMWLLLRRLHGVGRPFSRRLRL